MNLTGYLALFPQVQQAFALQGLTLSLAQALELYSSISAIVKQAQPPAAAVAPQAPFVPDTLTFGADANDAPYGYTLAGWSPQDHQGANLRDPQQAKYILYAYLVANKIVPTDTWATEALPILHALVPSVPWVALDTATLMYGSEYVHTAPNGHGMAEGTFNHAFDARQEFYHGDL